MNHRKTSKRKAQLFSSIDSTKKTKLIEINRKKVTLSMMKSLTDLQTSLICPLCHQILQSPATLACSHSFCLLCIDSYYKDNWVCPFPNCSMPISFHGDVRSKQSVSSMIGKCIRINPQLDTVVTSLVAVTKAIHLARDEWWKVAESKIMLEDECKITNISNNEDDNETNTKFGNDDEFIDFKNCPNIGYDTDLSLEDNLTSDLEKNELQHKDEKNNADSGNCKGQRKRKTVIETNETVTECLAQANEANWTGPRKNNKRQDKPDNSASFRYKSNQMFLTVIQGEKKSPFREDFTLGTKTFVKDASEQTREDDKKGNIEKEFNDEDNDNEDWSQNTNSTRTYSNIPSIARTSRTNHHLSQHESSSELTQTQTTAENNIDELPNNVYPHSSVSEQLPSPIPIFNSPNDLKTLEKSTNVMELKSPSTTKACENRNPPLILFLSSPSSMTHSSIQTQLYAHYGPTQHDVTNLDINDKSNSTPHITEAQFFTVLRKSYLSEHNLNTSDLFSNMYALSIQSEFATCDGYLVYPTFPYMLAVALGMIMVDREFLKCHFSLHQKEEENNTTRMDFAQNKNKNKNNRTTTNEKQEIKCKYCCNHKGWLFPCEYDSFGKSDKNNAKQESSAQHGLCIKRRPMYMSKNCIHGKKYHIIGDIKSENWLAPQKARRDMLEKETLESPVINFYKQRQSDSPKKSLPQSDSLLDSIPSCGLFKNYTFILCGAFDSLKGRKTLKLSHAASRISRRRCRNDFDQSLGTGTDNTSNYRNTIIFEESNLFTKERIKVLLQICKSTILDAIIDSEKDVIDSLLRSSAIKKNVVFLIRQKANARDFRIGKKIVDGLYSSNGNDEDNDARYPMVCFDWVLDSLSNYDIRPFERYKSDVNNYAKIGKVT